MTDQPKSGGRYCRDPETGKLTRRTDQPTAPVEGAAPADDRAPAKSTKPKGGR